MMTVVPSRAGGGDSVSLPSLLQKKTWDLRPYPEYKESDVPSLGKIPAHWKMMRSGYLFREVVDTGHPHLDLLSIARFRGIIRQSDIGRKERASKDRSGY